MALLKLKNNGKTILYIESLNTTVRPFRSPADYVLLDENKVQNDPHLIKCVLGGMISLFNLDNTEWGVVKKEETVEEKPVEKSIDIPKETVENKKTKAKEKKSKGKNKEEVVKPPQVIMAPKEKRITPELEKEPENSKPVVMSGSVAMRKAMTKSNETDIPNFLKDSNVKIEDNDSYENDPLEDDDGDIRDDNIVVV